MWQAFLISASFKNANLSGADLYNANVRGVDFSGANLTNTRLRNALCLDHAKFDDAVLEVPAVSPSALA